MCFGDSHTATGVNPSHTYAAASVFLVTLTVTDGGTPPLQASAQTSAQIQNAVQAQLLFKNGVINVKANNQEVEEQAD